MKLVDGMGMVTGQPFVRGGFYRDDSLHLLGHAAL
jgi:hypothetical protein